MEPLLNISYETLVRFLEAAGGNYRNAIYVLCSPCPFLKESGCGDFLFIPGFDCLPVILPITDAKNFFGFSIDPSDCAATLSVSTFCKLYQRWAEINLTDSRVCPIQLMLELFNKK